MTKEKKQYVCSACGAIQLRWSGKCPECGEWNTLEEEVVRAPEKVKGAMPIAAGAAQPVALSAIAHDDMPRLPLRMAELSRVLGGGIVPGSCVLVGGDPGIGKCVTGDTRVLDPSTGDFLPIETWSAQLTPVVALDTATHKLAVRPATMFHEQGVRAIVALKTRLGRTLRCTPNHPLLTPEGWRPAGELLSGTRIAAPLALPYFGNTPMPEHEVKLIAYALSDGSTCGNFNVTSALPEVAKDLAEIASLLNLQLKTYPKPNTNAIQYRLTRAAGERQLHRTSVATALQRVHDAHGFSWVGWARAASVNPTMIYPWKRGETTPSMDELQRLALAAEISIEQLMPEARRDADAKTPIIHLLDRVDLQDLQAREKHVPDCIFRLPRTQLALFLRVLFSCDGSLYFVNADSPGISYSTISERLAQDIQHLLLRFGFVAKLRTKHTRVNDHPYVAYELQLLGVAEVQRFVAEIGIWGRKAAKQRLAAMALPKLPSTHMDTIPTGPEFWTDVQFATQGESLRVVSRQMGATIRNRRHDRPLARSTVAALASAYPSPRLQALANGDVFWDEVVSVADAGEAPVYDLTVPEFANFVANDLIIHNSTLLLQMAADVATTSGRVLYVSAEESAHQIGRRATRLGIRNEELFILSEIVVDAIVEQIEAMKPVLVIVDSVQAIYSGSGASAAGTVSQVRDSAAALLRLGKAQNVPIFLVGHMTKEGTIAGPRVLEHMVDAVLQLEGERFHAFRLLRSVKNRFGSTNEVGVFEMSERGMEEVRNPSELFLAERLPNATGSAIAVSMEGTRPLLVEVQALSSTTAFSMPRRTGNGVDPNRLLLLTAVLSKRVGMDLHDQDIFVNIVGGMRVDEPAADLAIACAITSSYRNRPVWADLAIMGEVGLSGELRSVGQLARRLNEASKLGFKRALMPRSTIQRRTGDALPKDIEVIGVRTLQEALDVALVK